MAGISPAMEKTTPFHSVVTFGYLGLGGKTLSHIYLLKGTPKFQ